MNNIWIDPDTQEEYEDEYNNDGSIILNDYYGDKISTQE